MSGDRLAFDFITDERFRTVLESDYAEMLACAQHGAWKAVHVLGGSIVEAVLVDYLADKELDGRDPLSMPLGELIQVCRRDGVLSPRAAELSSALKAYRNLIHPGRSRRLDERADADGAIVAQALVSIIVKDVASKRQEAYGLTAEQIVRKIESDATALSIAEHLLRDTNVRELQRLLMGVLPERYFEEADEFVQDDSKLDAYAKLFRVAFDMAENPVKKKVTARFVRVLKEDVGSRVKVYEEQFFRAKDMAFLPRDDLELVRSHLLARLREDANPQLLRASHGIGSYLTAQEANAFVDPLAVLFIDPRRELAEAAQYLLATEANTVPSDVRDPIVRRLGQWEASYLGNPDLAQHAPSLRAIKQRYEVQDIPF